jgi:hypothetical protein
MSDDKTPEQLSAALGIPADRSWRKGERRSEVSPISKEHGYEFRAGPPDGASLEEQVSIVLARTEAAAERIGAMQGVSVELSCAVYSERVPAIHFTSSMIEKLHRLRAAIDVDLYIAEGNIGLGSWAGATDGRSTDETIGARQSRGDRTSITEAKLEEIERRYEAATPGPWKSYVEGRDHQSGSNFIETRGVDGSRGPDIEIIGAAVADQDFIAAAREDVPVLVEEIRRLQGLLDPRRRAT